MRRGILNAAILIFVLSVGLQGASNGVARLSRADYEDREKAAWMAQIVGTLLGLQFEHKPAAVKFTDSFAVNEISKRD
jgi:hypothetical protein